MKFPNHSFAKCNNDALTQLLVMHFSTILCFTFLALNAVGCG